MKKIAQSIVITLLIMGAAHAAPIQSAIRKDGARIYLPDNVIQSVRRYNTSTNTSTSMSPTSALVRSLLAIEDDDQKVLFRSRGGTSPQIHVYNISGDPTTASFSIGLPAGTLAAGMNHYSGTEGTFLFLADERTITARTSTYAQIFRWNVAPNMLLGASGYSSRVGLPVGSAGSTLHSIAVHPTSHNLYISDRGTGAIHRIKNSGAASTDINSTWVNNNVLNGVITGLTTPTYLGISSDGKLLFVRVSEVLADIRVYDLGDESGSPSEITSMTTLKTGARHSSNPYEGLWVEKNWVYLSRYDGTRVHLYKYAVIPYQRPAGGSPTYTWADESSPDAAGSSAGIDLSPVSGSTQGWTPPSTGPWDSIVFTNTPDGSGNATQNKVWLVTSADGGVAGNAAREDSNPPAILTGISHTSRAPGEVVTFSGYNLAPSGFTNQAWFVLKSASQYVGGGAGTFVTLTVAGGVVSATVPATLTPGEYNVYLLSNDGAAYYLSYPKEITITNTVPNSPTSLNQFHGTGTSTIPTNGWTNQASVTFRFTVSDPDGGTVTPQVGVVLTSASFPGAPTHTGTAVASGSQASVTVSGLADGDYKWRARASDGVLTSSWVSFGTTDPDFRVDRTAPAIPSTNPLDSATGVAANTTVQIRFSDEMNTTDMTSTGSYTLSGSDSGAHTFTASYDSATLTVTLTPDVAFTTNESIDVLVRGGTTSGVRDKAGNRLVTDFTFNFRIEISNPASAPENLIATRSGNDLVLTWSASTTGPVTIYRVYRSTDPAIPIDDVNLIASVSSPTVTYTDIGVLPNTVTYYYVVTAINAAGSSTASNTAYLLFRPIEFNPPESGLGNKAWISVPNVTAFTNAQELVDHINNGPIPGSVNKITRFNPTTQEFESLTFFPADDENGIPAEWATTPAGSAPFPMVVGEAYEITITGDANVYVAGSHDPNFRFQLVFAADRGNKNWVSIPYNATYTNAQDIVNSINSGAEPGSTIKITRFNPTTQEFESLTFFPADDENGIPAEWAATPVGSGPFTFRGGEGFEITISSNMEWTPNVP